MDRYHRVIGEVVARTIGLPWRRFRRAHEVVYLYVVSERPRRR